MGAANLGGCKKHIFRTFTLEKSLYRRLIREVELGMGAVNGIGIPPIVRRRMVAEPTSPRCPAT